jgi:signal transduction histidine kinase
MAVLGHDLRNPLSAIYTAGMLIGRQSSEERVQRTAARIVSSSQRMARMIEQILDFTRIRAGIGLPYQPAAMDLRDLVERVREELPSGESAIRVEAVGATDGVWDHDRLAQVLSNLLGNAVEHSSLGKGIVIQIDGSSPAWVVVTVQNPGAIPPEVLPEVFEPFRQGRPSGSKGLGLGLFITREIVAAHGGDIDVESSEAQGTRFRFVLPRAPASPAQRPRS